MSAPKLTAHKAWSGGGSGFLAMLFAPIGTEPNATYAIVVLLSALFSPWTEAPIDGELLGQAMKTLWAAIFAGLGIHQAVYWTPNKLKDLLPMVTSVLGARGDGRPANPIAARTEEPAKPGDASAGGSGAGGSIASIAPLLFAGLVAAILLSGCAANDPAEQLEELAPQLKPEEKSAVQAAADKLFNEAIGPEHRAVRLCMIGSGVIEVMTDRVTHADTDYAATALGQIVAVRSVLADLDTDPLNIWFETDVKIVTLELARVLVDSAKDRVPRLITNLAGSVNVLGVLDRAGVAARQAALTEGVVLDTKRTVALIGDGKLQAEDARAACDGRIDKNEARLKAILGAR